MNREDIAGGEQLLLRHVKRAMLRGRLPGHVLAPGDRAHPESLRHPRGRAAGVAEAQKSDRLAMQVATDRYLPASLAERSDFARDVPRRREDERPGKFRRGRWRRRGPANRDA